jgi:hypothetical protein
LLRNHIFVSEYFTLELKRLIQHEIESMREIV